MTEYAYLIYLHNPFDLSKEPEVFLQSLNSKPKRISLKELFEVKYTIISYNLTELFSYYKGRESVHSNSFIDVSLAAKLIFGIKREDTKASEPWNIWNMLKKQFGKHPEIQILWQYIYEGKRDIDKKTFDSCIANIFKLLKKIWIKLEKELKQKGEGKRFFQIEKPIHEIFLKQQVLGVKIDQDILIQRLDKIDYTIGLAGKNLRDKWAIGDPSDGIETAKALRNNGFSCLAECQQYSTFSSLLDFHADHAELPKYLKMYRDNYKDKNILLRLCAIGSDRVYPSYNTLGTVTGRILVESPGLQYLKRSHRDLFVPDDGKMFLYPDYSQFEPGILADDSKDRELIAGFNSGDLYTALSIELFDSKAHRESAKILFLAFCYGMKEEQMVRLAAEVTGDKIEKIQKILANFFGKYTSLSSWKHQLMNELLKEGRIGTRLGNYRYREHRRKTLSSEEQRWVLSQRVQGTASLIFKRVILSISRTFPDIDIILPMHDALLLQLPFKNYKSLKSKVGRIFIEEFKNECSTIKPRLSFDDFARDKVCSNDPNGTSQG